MAAEVKINAPFVEEKSTNEEFHDANTEHLQKSSNLDDCQPTEEDLAVQTEPVRKESSPHVSETAVELADIRDRNTAEAEALASNPPQEDVKCERGEGLGSGVADTENELAEQQFLEEGRKEDEEAVVENASSDSREREVAEEEGSSMALENEPTERDAVDDSEQKEGSDLGDNDSTEEELAYEAKTDSSHSEEEESEQDKYDEEDEAEGEEEEGEQDKCGEEDEAEGEEEEGEQDKCDEEDEAEGDGWEEPAEGADFDTVEKEKKTEKPKDPSVVPRDNRYFLHDMREGEEIREDDQDEQDTQVAEEEPKTEADRVVRWEHDLFVHEEQGPRSEEEKKKDAWRFDDTQGGRGRGRGRGFRQGRGQRFGYQGQGHDRDQRYDSRDQRRDGHDRRYDSRDQRRDGRDQRYDSRDPRYDGLDQRRDNQNQGYDGRYQSRDGQDQRYGRDQRHDDRYQRRDDQYQRYGRDQRHNSQNQRRGGYHRQDRQQRSDDDSAGSWDDKSNHHQQQKRPDDEEDGSLVVATGQEYDGKKDHRQDGRPSYSRGSFIKGGNFHRGGFVSPAPTRSERNHGGARWEEKKKTEEGGELSEGAVMVGKRPEGEAMVEKRPEGAAMVGKRPEGETMVEKRPEGAAVGKRPESAAMVRKRPEGAAMGKRPEGAAMGKRPEGAAVGKRSEGAAMGKRPEGAAMVGKRPEGAAMVGKGTEDANDLPQISKKPPWNDSSSHQMNEGRKVSPKGDQQEQPAQQSEELLSQSKGVQQKSLFGKGTSQDMKPGKERRPARLYSLARGRPTSGVGASGTKPGAAPEEGSMDDTGKGHGSSSQPRSSKVPGSAHPVRTERSEEPIYNDPPGEGEGEGEKGGGPKRYSIQRGSGEGGAAQKPVQGYPVFFMMPGDQYAQTTLASSNEPNPQGSPQHSSGGGKRPKTQTAKGQQKALLATPAETAPYGLPFIPGPGPPGVGGPVLQYMQPVEGMPPLAMAMDPAMMMGNWEELGHFHGGLFIPHVPPEGQRMMMPVPGDSPQHVQPTPHQPKQRSRAIPIVAPQATQEGEQALDTMESIS